MAIETAECRHCHRKLNGKPYCNGNLHAVNPETGKEARINYYGGFVCSEHCDYQACREQESSMPGAGRAVLISSGAAAKVRENWSPANGY